MQESLRSNLLGFAQYPIIEWTCLQVHVLSGCNSQCKKALFAFFKDYWNNEENEAMSILSYFKPSPLPTPKETGIEAAATKEVNQAVSHVQSQINEPVEKK